MRILILLMLVFSFNISAAQKKVYTIAEIPTQLTENANAVVRYNKCDVIISSRRDLTIKTLRVVSILNEWGLKNIDAVEFRNVKSIEATIYDAYGKEIKRFRRGDFKDVAYSSGSIITDNRATYLEFTPTQYPFTIVYESTVGDSNTAFLPQWMPLNQPLLSVETSILTVSAPAELGLKTKESNFEGHAIMRTNSSKVVSYEATNLPALKIEQYAPALEQYAPGVKLAIEKFHLEGLDGTASTWEQFSSWCYENLLGGTTEISDQTKATVQALVGDEQDKMKKAALIYKYVQDKTRYVSIQLGIGGWRPMNAKDVDRLGYGDCKALTNYTRVLLEAVGIPSYYAVVYGDQQKKDIDSEFVSTQGNHVILAIPNEDEFIWLECTNQTMPFGFLGDFTDDRLALLIRPQGGGLVRTSAYIGRSNSQISVGNYALDRSGSISGVVDIRSRGIQYDNKLALETKTVQDLDLHYKNYFKFGNLKLSSTKLVNDKVQSELTESIVLNATGYADAISNRLIFAVNAFNQNAAVPQRYRSRYSPFEISRGYHDSDQITIDLPEGYIVETIPVNISIQDKFGEYMAEFSIVGPRKMLYKRDITINKGNYPADDYEGYRKFFDQIARAENSKMVLVKS